MCPWLEPSQETFVSFEHAHEFPVDIRMYMFASFSFDQLELEGNLVSFEDLAFLREDDFDTCSLSRLQGGLGLYLMVMLWGISIDVVSPC